MLKEILMIALLLQPFFREIESKKIVHYRYDKMPDFGFPCGRICDAFYAGISKWDDFSPLEKKLIQRDFAHKSYIRLAVHECNEYCFRQKGCRDGCATWCQNVKYPSSNSLKIEFEIWKTWICRMDLDLETQLRNF